MKKTTVRDIMTPLSEYGTISVEATLFEAAMALDEVQKAYEKNAKGHRLLLITDVAGHVVGKLSQLDILRALEPKGKHIEGAKSLSRFGFSPEYLKPMLDLCGFWEKPLLDLCRESGNLKVRRLLHAPAKGERIAEDTSIPEAIHQLAMEYHQSLLVKRGRLIVGILRQSDLFKEVVDTLSVCEL